MRTEPLLWPGRGWEDNIKKCILKKSLWLVWAGLIRLRITNVSEPSGSIQCGEFIDLRKCFSSSRRTLLYGVGQLVN